MNPPIATQTAVKRAASGAETRIAAYLLTEYLERLGVEVIFGLCGHTVIAFLDALGKSKIRFISTRHEQIAAHAADGYARGDLFVPRADEANLALAKRIEECDHRVTTQPEDHFNTEPLEILGQQVRRDARLGAGRCP